MSRTTDKRIDRALQIALMLLISLAIYVVQDKAAALTKSIDSITEAVETLKTAVGTLNTQTAVLDQRVGQIERGRDN